MISIGTWDEARSFEPRAAADSESELNTETDRSKGRKRTPVEKYSPSNTPTRSSRRSQPTVSPVKKKTRLTRASFILDSLSDVDEDFTPLSQILESLNPEEFQEQESELAVPLEDT